MERVLCEWRRRESGVCVGVCVCVCGGGWGGEEKDIIGLIGMWKCVYIKDLLTLV